MSDTATDVAVEYAEWGFVPYVVRDLFEDPSPAAVAATLAYTARCEHSDALTDMGQSEPAPPPSPDVPRGTARAFLDAHAAELLGHA